MLEIISKFIFLFIYADFGICSDISHDTIWGVFLYLGGYILFYIVIKKIFNISKLFKILFFTWFLIRPLILISILLYYFNSPDFSC